MHCTLAEKNRTTKLNIPNILHEIHDSSQLRFKLGKKKGKIVNPRRKTTSQENKNCFYHINFGVIQGFPALRKAVTTHVKIYRIFFMCFDIANQLLTRHSPLAPLG